MKNEFSKTDKAKNKTGDNFRMKIKINYQISGSKLHMIHLQFIISLNFMK